MGAEEGGRQGDSVAGWLNPSSCAGDGPGRSEHKERLPKRNS